MWRTLLITVLCGVSAFCYSINFNGRAIDVNSDLVFKEPIHPDSIEEDVEVEHIYYRTNLKSDLPYEDENDLRHRYEFSSENSTEEEEEDPTFQPWSILWYIGSFGGLIAFFLVVSCSEWCCRSRGRRRDSEISTGSSPSPSEAPPPAYDLFAPPSYESLCTNGEKSDYEVFVVPVHAMETLTGNQVLQRNEATAPPAYFAGSTNIRRDTPNEVVLNVARAEAQHRDSLKGVTQT